MDRTGNLLSMFSRGSTPPPDRDRDTQQQQQQQQRSPPQSYREPAPPSPQKTIDSLFRNITVSSGSPHSSIQAGGNYGPSAQSSSSAPTTPVSSITAASISSSASAGNPSTERQSALLSLLGSVASPSGSATSATTAGPSSSNQLPIPQQAATPPGQDPRLRPSPAGNEAQGKYLLEQLMSG